MITSDSQCLLCYSAEFLLIFSIMHKLSQHDSNNDSMASIGNMKHSMPIFSSFDYAIL